MSNWVFSTHNPRQNITMYSNNLTNKDVPDCKPVLQGLLGHGRDGIEVLHVIHKDGWESAIKVIPHWDKKTPEEKARIEQEFRWLDDERMYHKHIIRARDAFVVKGNVKAKLYNNEWKYVRSTLKDGSKAVFEVVEEKEISQPEADACGESYCIVLEIHRNGTIADEIKAKNDKIKAGSKRQAAAYTEEEIWKLLIEMTCAVGTMHWIENDKKPLYLLHRDLRTSNILSRDIGCCGIKLCGFGLTAPETEHVEIANPTTDDMKVWPPERARGEKVNNRCDIFMLGAAVYEMMALQPIHEVKDGNIGKFGEELNEGNIEPLDKTMARQYSRELVSLVMLMLHKEADKRPEVLDLMALIRQYRPEVYDEAARAARLWGDCRYDQALDTIEENNKSIAIGDFKAAPEVAGYSKGASDINERSHKLTSIIESLSGLSVAVACN